MKSVNPILDKIKKLLRMKRGGTPAEIETALALAREIAAKNGIDIESVDPDEAEKTRTVSHEAQPVGRVQTERLYASKIIREFFNVDIVWDYTVAPVALTIIGRAHDIEIAKYVNGFLVFQFRSCWNRAKKKFRNRRAFLHGMYLAIAAKLETDRAQYAIPGLTLSLESYKLQLFKNLKPFAAAAPAVCPAMAAGWIEGQKTNIRKGVESASPLQLT